jgi:purine-binding chemotaxis protein CheW
MKINELSKGMGNIPVNDTTTGTEELIAESDIFQLVSFLLEDIEYGIDILKVHEIMRPPEITRLPNTPSYIIGVINLRGSVIPVVDVRERFNFPKQAATELTRIIVIETGEKLVGLMVDNVYQVVRLPKSQIDPPSDLIEGISEEFINGIGRLADRLVIILNLDSILFTQSERGIE